MSPCWFGARPVRSTPRSVPGPMPASAWATAWWPRTSSRVRIGKWSRSSDAARSPSKATPRNGAERVIQSGHRRCRRGARGEFGETSCSGQSGRLSRSGAQLRAQRGTALHVPCRAVRDLEPDRCEPALARRGRGGNEARCAHRAAHADARRRAQRLTTASGQGGSRLERADSTHNPHGARYCVAIPRCDDLLPAQRRCGQRRLLPAIAGRGTGSRPAAAGVVRVMNGWECGMRTTKHEWKEKTSPARLERRFEFADYDATRAFLVLFAVLFLVLV